MKKIKLIIEFIKLKHQGYNKEERYFEYAIKGLINFEQYEKFFDKTVLEQDADYDEILTHIPRID